MTTYYVGKGGSDSNGGESWDDRLETLNGAEDQPIAAGDTVYVGAGSYHETLTVDVSGSSGSIISYIADVTGAYTDGVGGTVRITGVSSSIPDSAVRAYCIDMSGGVRDYRTFTGFFLDGVTTTLFNLSPDGLHNLVIEDFTFGTTPALNNIDGIGLANAQATVAGDLITIRRCLFDGMVGNAISLVAAAGGYSLTNSRIENCIFNGLCEYAIYFYYIYGITIINCTFLGQQINQFSIYVEQTSGAHDCWIYNCFEQFIGSSCIPDNCIIENYCTKVVHSFNPQEAGYTPGGSNNGNVISCWIPPTLYGGFKLQNVPIWGQHAPWSVVAQYASGSTPPSDDFYGTDRPAAAAKVTRGAIQYHEVERETTTVPSGEVESIKMRDFTVYHIPIPVTGKQMKFSVEVYREADYTGTNPQMIIKQPGQSAQTVTDAGAVSQFNLLNTAFTPSNTPAYVIMELRSNNTATTGNYDVFFGKIGVR